MVDGNVTKNVTLAVGNLDGNNVINSSDLADLLDNYNSSGASLAGDFDENGIVNSADLADLLNNYNAVSTVEN